MINPIGSGLELSRTVDRATISVKHMIFAIQIIFS